MIIIRLYIHSNRCQPVPWHWLCHTLEECSNCGQQCPPKALGQWRQITLLAVESRHLQIWSKDEYETKLQNVTFYFGWLNTYMFYQLRSSALLDFHPFIWCEHKYWDSFLTGLSKWSAVSCCINSSDIKSRECVVSVISITSVFWIMHSIMTHTQTRMKTRELTLREKQAIWMLKENKSNRALAKTKGMEKSRVWKPPATPTTTWSAEKTTVDDDRQIIKAVKINPKRRVCKITNNVQKAEVMLWRSSVLRRLWHRITDATARCKPLTSTKHRKTRLEFAKQHKGEPEEFLNCVYGPMRQRWTKVMGKQNCGEKGNYKRSQSWILICKAWWRWCHGVGMHDCLWNNSTDDFMYDKDVSWESSWVIPVYIMKQRFKIRFEHHWPRALGSPLTENIDLYNILF